MLRIGMLTSGGDCQALNAAMRGVVKGVCTKRDDVEIYGFEDGYKGLIYGNFHMLTSKDFSGILTRGGTILGTSRQPFKLMRVPDKDGLDKVAAMKHTYHKLSLDCLVILGGNGTHKTANLLREEGLNVVTLPKTIDNDLIHTDHTPGFGSAARYVASTVREITIDANVYEKKSVTIIEIMGRHAGWLTAASALARKYTGDNPLLIYLPETAFNQEEFLKAVENSFEKNCNVIVCVSEGIHDDKGTFICEYDNSVGTDTFGHKMLAGCGKYLENLVRNRLGVKARSVELNVSQRCSASMMSATDQQEAIKAGEFGVKAALNGETGKMISFIRKETSDGTYTMECGLEDVNAICNEEKTVPSEWITEDGSDVTEAFINYARPLIQGTVQIPCGEDGLPSFVYRK
jgi:6-phosphofructokinase